MNGRFHLPIISSACGPVNCPLNAFGPARSVSSVPEKVVEPADRVLESVGSKVLNEAVGLVVFLEHNDARMKISGQRACPEIEIELDRPVSE